MLVGNHLHRFAVEPFLLQKLAQRGSDAVMVADGIGAYARVAAVWIFRETNPVLRRQRKASQLGSSPSQVLPCLRRRDSAGGFRCEKKHLPVAEQGEGFDGRKERRNGFSETRRSLGKKIPPVADCAVDAARQFPLTAPESLKGKLELFKRCVAERNPLRLELEPVEPDTEGSFKKLLQLRTSQPKGQDRFTIRFQIQIS